ncbi:MAG: sulfatase-like hydrolase/transferase [Chloroflexota bacterium]
MNFIFIMTDQLRPDHTGYGGNPIVQTPNLDKLAAQSRRFQRAYCTNPICGPSRSSIFTGRMPSAHGNWVNMLGLDWHANTFVRVLRENGYRTALVGKSHLQEHVNRRELRRSGTKRPLDIPSPNQLRRFKRYPLSGEGDAVTQPWAQDWNSWEDVVRHRKQYVEMPADYYGFESVELVCSHDDTPEGHYRHWFVENGGDLETMGGVANAVEVADSWQQVYCSNVPVELYPTSYITERALASLDQFAAADAPFFLNVSYPDPHHPFCPPEPYYSLYGDADVPLPNTFYDPHQRSMPHQQQAIAARGEDVIGPFLVSPSEAQYQAAARAEYGSITMLDAGIGRILARLDELGLSENTTIIFCSDHGDMFGDHGLMLKFGCHYDGTVRVPLLIKTPSMAGGDANGLVSLMDIAPTILGLADCQPYVGMQGIDLKPMLEDEMVTVRESVLIEEDLPFDMLGVGQNTNMRTLITRDARLTVYSGAKQGELFDWSVDPAELENLYNQTSHTILQSQLMTQLVHMLVENRPIERSP